MSKKSTLMAALLLTITAGANAGSFANGEWTSAKCGAEPVMPQLNLETRNAYNQSVAQMDAYRRDIRTYLQCAIPESNEDAKAITKSMADKINSLATTEAQYKADTDAASARFRQAQ